MFSHLFLILTADERKLTQIECQLLHLTFRTLYCHNRFLRNFYNQPSYLLDNVQENHLGDRQSKMLKDALYRRKKFCEELELREEKIIEAYIFEVYSQVSCSTLK